MKKLVLVVLCLFLTGCGEFVVNVRIVPQATGTTQTQVAAATLQPENLQVSDTPTVSPLELPTTTAVVAATPTSGGLQAGQPISLAAIQMSDFTRGWGVESSGHIVNTNDGGWTWKDVTPFQGTFGVHGLFAFNNETAWAVPPQLQINNVVWSTRDSGVTWEASQPIPLGDGEYNPLGLQFPDARNGWLLLLAHNGTEGSHVLLYKSGDGGQNWERASNLIESISQSYLPDTHTTMAFFDGQTGWLGGWWGKDNPNQWMVLKTVDGGANWQTEALSLPSQSSLTCDGRPITEIALGDMAVDMSCTQVNDPAFLYHHLYYLSATGLPAWRSWKLSGRFLSVYFLNANQGWMMTAPGGSLNEIYRTNNGGETWANINVVAWKQASFDFVTGQSGWAIASDGSAAALVHTTNGGQTWAEIKPVVTGH